MKRLLAALTLALVAGLTAVTPAHSAAKTPNPYYGTTGWRSPQLVLGDSTTVRAWGLYRNTIRYRGELNGVAGRSVEELLPLVFERLRSKSPVQTAVLALGTNGGKQTFTEAHLLTAIRLLKARGATKIILPTPYRTRKYADWWKVAQRAQWMRDAANTQKGVCVAEWAWYASTHPRATTDGIHLDPTSYYGGVYINLINARMKSCS